MRSSSASAFSRSCSVISAIEHPGQEAACGMLMAPWGVLDGPGAFILGQRHAGRIEPSSPAAPDLNCLDINVSYGEAWAEAKWPRQWRHPHLGNGGRKTGSAWVDAAVHGDPG